MTKLAAPGFAIALALAALVGLGDSTATSQETPGATLPIELVKHVPAGQCRIEYDGLPQDRQPAAMECEHARWVAQRWGGRVMQSNGEEMLQLAAYDGANNFTGVPSEALPAPGYCRVWVDGVPADAQGEQTDCRMARRLAEALNGRVLYMPL